MILAPGGHSCPTRSLSASVVDELGRWVDHLRQVGIRGFIAEHTNDADFARPAPLRTRRRQPILRISRHQPSEPVAAGAQHE